MSEYNLEDKIVESAKKSQEFVVEKRRVFIGIEVSLKKKNGRNCRDIFEGLGL